MSAPLDDQLGFAPDYDAAIPYMQRTRDYYAAIGYTTPYRWAHYVEAPFQPLKKPLAKSRVTIVTTAAKYDPTKGDQGPGAAYNGSAKFYHISATTASTPRPPTAAPGFRCRSSSKLLLRAGSVKSRRASSARRPTAAIVSPSTSMRPTSSPAARPTRSMSP